MGILREAAAKIMDPVTRIQTGRATRYAHHGIGDQPQDGSQLLLDFYQDCFHIIEGFIRMRNRWPY